MRKGQTTWRPVHVGIDRRDFERLVLEAGGTAETRRRTGEVVFRHPACAAPLVMNRRRKDTSRAAVSWLNKIYSLIHPEAAQ